MQLRWLHISDLHAGQNTQNWLWPGLKTTFFDDLERLIPAMGGVDLVIFSGDLTQSGSQADFDTLKRMLDEIWMKFKSLDCNPQLFMVPGNHDLIRPNESDPVTVAMQSWWDKSTVKDTFWNSPVSAYRQFVNTAFSGYSKFRRDLLSDGFPLCPVMEGVLPGDCSHVFTKDGLRVGLVGLNSTFLQLSSVEDPKLDLDVRQLLAVTNNEPDEWCRANHVNLLITHHPASWLAEEAVKHLNAEIYTPTRFTAHLFGHMHAPYVETHGKGGSTDRKLIQAASLYGLRKCANGKHDRIHGYSGARLEVGESSGRILIWPRIGKTIVAGSRKFVPDNDFDLSEQNNFELNLGRIGNLSGITGLTVVSPLTGFGTAQEEAALAAKTSSLNSSNQPLRCSPQHLHVRKLEQERLRIAIDNHRVAWISADWGYAVDEFIGSVMSTLNSPVSATYRIDLIDYRDRNSFLSKFSADVGCSFQEFCKSISGIDRVLLILEDAPVYRQSVPGSESWSDEIESIVKAIREYCPNSLVILTSRQPPTRTQLPIIEITPLDEPDVKAYVTEHPLGGPNRSNPSDVADILRLTGGLPLEIDAMLRELGFISLQELIELRLTAPRTKPIPTTGHDLLIPAINSLMNADDPDVARSFDLLVALSGLPYGETLMRIKRFDSQRAFYPSQAAILSDRGLIESVTTSVGLKVRSATDAPSPKLVAKKIVRQAVEAVLTPEALDQRDSRAAALYFGDRWTTGEVRSIRTTDLAALEGAGGLGNPHAVINSLLQRSVEIDDTDRIKHVVKLARIFIANLSTSKSYRNSVIACQDFIKLVPPSKEYQDDINYFRWNLARCLRMLGRREEAIEIFKELETTKFERLTKQRILLNWALAIQHSDDKKAKDLAQQAVAKGKGTLPGLHAQALVLELSPEIPNRFDQLRTLENRARSKKAMTVANNISHFLATNENISAEEQRSRLRTIASTSKRNGDPYSAARSIVQLALLTIEKKEPLTAQERAGLVEAYHYLYNQRISSLFHKCHKGLWQHFVENHEIENLLRLFRHSSFIWRIHGQDSLERPYIKQLLEILPSSHTKRFEPDSTESAYLYTRASSKEC